MKASREWCEEVEAELLQAKEKNVHLEEACTKAVSEMKEKTSELHSQVDAYAANAEALGSQLAEAVRARDDALSELSAAKLQLSEVQTAGQRAAETAMHELTEVRWQAMKTESALIQRARDLGEALRSAQDDAAQEIKKLRGEMRRLREEVRKADVAAGGSCVLQ